MVSTGQRILLFSICIISRLGLFYWASRPEGRFFPRLISALFAIASLVLYFTGWRKTGIETFGRPIYWNSFRPVHALLHGLAAVFDAPILVLADTLIGILVFFFLGGVLQ